MNTIQTSFFEELKKFFEDTNHFLIETVEGYSMSGEDDKEKDTLLEKITQLQAKISSIFGIKVEECDEEYLAPSTVHRAAVPDEGIIEETYEEPQNANNTALKPKPTTQAEGILEDVYEVTGEENEEGEGLITDDETYEDPYADRRRKGATPPPAATHQDSDTDYDNDEEDETYEDTTVPESKESDVKSAKLKEGKKSKKEKKNSKKERNASDNKSEGSNEDTVQKDIPASDLADAEFQGMLKKHREKNSFFQNNRWCAIKDRVLYYFESKKSKKQKGAIILDTYHADEVKEEVEKKKFVFQLTCPGKKSYYFTTQKLEDMKKWVHYIHTGTILEEEEEAESNGSSQQQQKTVQAAESEATLPDEEVYEDPETTHGNADGEAEDDDGIFEEMYEDPETLVREKIPEAPDSDDDSEKHSGGSMQSAGKSGAPPPLPSRSDQPPLPGRSDQPPLPGRSDQPPLPGRGDQPRLDSVKNGKEPRSLPPPLPNRSTETTLSSPRKPIDVPTAEIEPGEEFYDDAESEKLPPPPPSPTPSPPVVRKKEVSFRGADSLPPPPEEATNFEAMYYGLWSCHQVTDEELEFTRGDTIEILNKDKYGGNGWWIGKLGPKVGLVPKSYVSPMYMEIKT